MTSEPPGASDRAEAFARRHVRHNVLALGADFALFFVGLSFAAQSTILPAFAAHLGAPNVIIGAIPALMATGWLLPPLFAAGHTETLARKLPFVLRYTICERLPFLGLAAAAFFLAVFFATLAFAFLEPYFFIGYLISIALFGLYQAIFMANAGAAWDNAKKIVEVELKEKGTPLHAATVVGDTVGDQFKDTSSVAMNPIIKFTTLFGLLAVELAVSLTANRGTTLTRVLAAVFFVVSVVFVWRSFYAMRIRSGAPPAASPARSPAH